MKISKNIRTYCPRCRKHSSHTVSLYKRGRDRAMAVGARRYTRKKAGYGSQPKPVPKKFAKTTKKQSLKFKCSDCGFTQQRKGMRLRKLEIV
ncbi:MAG: 50S ribosomal protein L44e [Promethearchaeota archaeon]